MESGLQCLWSVTYGHCTVIFAPTGSAPTLPTAENTLSYSLAAKISHIVIVPSFLKTWARSDEHLKLLKNIHFISFGGGPLTKEAGDKIVNAGVWLKSVYGGTEFGVPMSPLRLKEGEHGEKDRKDWDIGADSREWEWQAFAPNAELRWEAQGDGTYELIFMVSVSPPPRIRRLNHFL